MGSNFSHTLTNPQNGNLAFKIFSFNDVSHFDHVQRLNYFVLILLRQGKGTLTADFSEHKIKGPAILCFAPYQPFMLKGNTDMIGQAICFHPDFFCILKHHDEVSCNGVLFNNAYETPIIEVNKEQMDSFVDIAGKMKTEMEVLDLAHHDLLISFLKIFLITATRIKVSIEQAKKDTQPTAENRMPGVLHHLKDAIETNYRKKHSAAQYAEILNMSPKALAKLCKAHFNKTLTDLISERIIIEAKRELYLTSKTVKEIAYELGYSDEYYFSRFFKNYSDVSPQLYRDTVGFNRAEA